MKETSSCTSGSVAAHLPSMSRPTSLGTSVTALTLTRTMGSSVNRLNFMCTFVPSTSLFKMGSTEPTTELLMARFRNGHITRTARFNHPTRSTSGYVIHRGSWPMMRLSESPLSTLWSYVSSFSARMM